MSLPAAGFYGPVADHARTPGRSRGTTRQQRALTGAAHVLRRAAVQPAIETTSALL
jgi:hypothetical protein